MDNVRREAADRLLMAVSVTMTTCAIIEGPQQSKRQRQRTTVKRQWRINSNTTITPKLNETANISTL